MTSYEDRFWTEKRDHAITRVERNTLRDSLERMETRTMSVLDDYLAGKVSADSLRQIRRELEFQRHVVRGVPRPGQTPFGETGGAA